MKKNIYIRWQRFSTVCSKLFDKQINILTCEGKTAQEDEENELRRALRHGFAFKSPTLQKSSSALAVTY